MSARTFILFLAAFILAFLFANHIAMLIIAGFLAACSFISAMQDRGAQGRRF